MSEHTRERMRERECARGCARECARGCARAYARENVREVGACHQIVANIRCYVISGYDSSDDVMVEVTLSVENVSGGENAEHASNIQLHKL